MLNLPIDTKTQNSLFNYEAKSSAAIENEFEPETISAHSFALTQYVYAPLSNSSLLNCHAVMMQGKPHAQPGMYRTVEVRVGRHVAPGPSLVPSMMTELFNYLERSDDTPLVKAAWGHIEFETVHPFADGNGRTGRALISKLLGMPLPLSAWILRHRLDYYRMLDSGKWDEYFEWFLTGVLETCQAIHD